MKIKARQAKIRDIYAYGTGRRVLGVYITLGAGKCAKTREILPEVFADYDRNGLILGIEFSRPGDYDIDAMQQVSEVAKAPVLRAIDISKLPITQEEEASVGR